MKINHNTIASNNLFEAAVAAYAEAIIAHEGITNETSAAFKASDRAQACAYDALIAVIDAHVARQVASSHNP